MNREQLRALQPEAPLSITIGAPRVVTLEGGQKVRIPSTLDYRIVAVVEDALTPKARVVRGARKPKAKDVKPAHEPFEDMDRAVLMLYCALHTTEGQILALWKAARKPLDLWDTVLVWQAGQKADPMSAALTELMEYTAEMDDLAGSDDDDTGSAVTGKKKTG